MRKGSCFVAPFLGPFRGMADRGRVGSLVFSSKSCAEKEWRKAHEKMDHFRSNLKKERLLEDRYMEIDRQNRVLLKRMSEAMRKPNPYVVEKKEAAPPSLNRSGRKMEMVQPVYSHKKWEEHYQKSGRHLKNCCAYPVITRMSRGASAPSVMMQIASEVGAAGAVPASAVPSSVASPVAKGASSAAAPEEDRRFVLKEGLRIGETYYLLEMSTDGRILNVSAYDGESKASLELIIKEKAEHREIH
eukprot:g9322.t1